MLRKLLKSETIETSMLGGFCPYWTLLDGTVLVADSAEEIIQALPEHCRVIDPVAVFELLHFNSMLGNRTLVQGVKRMPWRAVLKGDGSIERRPPIKHGSMMVSAREAAKLLREKLEKELVAVLVKKPSKVWLLLTGGLDSRVVAGVLKKMENELSSPIVCATWGHEQSRDVVYARRIANWYGWEHVNIPYNQETGWENIQRAAVWGGAEVAGIHLHGEYWFEKAGKNDLVLASSFGDSVGRAEFSGVHVKELKLHPIMDSKELFHPSLSCKAVADAENDRRISWHGEDDSPAWIKCELDQQENYMRRMICHVMDYVRQFCRLHQAFTSDEVVSFMWSLSPDCRNDDIYKELLKDMDERLYSLPWARTGVAFDGSVERDQALRKNYHEWGKWLREDLRDRLHDLLFSHELKDLGVIFGPDLACLWGTFLSESVENLGSGEKVVKLCSMELARRHFNLQPCRDATPLRDRLSDIKWRLGKMLRGRI